MKRATLAMMPNTSCASLRAGSAGEGDGRTPYGTALVSAICSSPSRSRTCHEWFDSKCVFQPICCSSMALDPYVVSNWQLDSFHLGQVAMPSPSFPYDVPNCLAKVALFMRKSIQIWSWRPLTHILKILVGNLYKSRLARPKGRPSIRDSCLDNRSRIGNEEIT